MSLRAAMTRTASRLAYLGAGGGGEGRQCRLDERGRPAFPRCTHARVERPEGSQERRREGDGGRNALSKQVLELVLADAVHQVLHKQRLVRRQVLLGHHDGRSLGRRLGRAVRDGGRGAVGIGRRGLARRELALELVLLRERVVVPCLLCGGADGEAGEERVSERGKERPGWRGAGRTLMLFAGLDMRVERVGVELADDGVGPRFCERYLLRRGLKARAGQPQSLQSRTRRNERKEGGGAHHRLAVQRELLDVLERLCGVLLVGERDERLAAHAQVVVGRDGQDGAVRAKQDLEAVLDDCERRGRRVSSSLGQGWMGGEGRQDGPGTLTFSLRFWRGGRGSEQSSMRQPNAVHDQQRVRIRALTLM